MSSAGGKKPDGVPCVRCGSRLSEGMTFCVACGFSNDAAVAERRLAAEQEVDRRRNQQAGLRQWYRLGWLLRAFMRR